MPILAPSEPFSRTAPRTAIAAFSVAPIRCVHLGGTDPCPRLERLCSQCGLAICQHEPRSEVGSRRLHAACVDAHTAHGACVVCGSLSPCACAPTIVGGYHGTRPRQIPVPEALSEPLIGLELEAIYPALPETGRPDPLAIGEAHHGIDAAILAHETDSSLGAAGVETITVPMPLSIAREAIPDLISARLSIGGTAEDERCGGHVHVTATPSVLRGGHRIAASYAAPAQIAVWDALAGRASTYQNSPLPPLRGNLPLSRAAIWHSTRARTIEWRHPAGTDDPRVAIARAEILLDTLAHAASLPDGAVWGWGIYLRDRPVPTPATRYAWALLRSIGL